MSKYLWALSALAMSAPVRAEVHTLTLKQAVAQAVSQNPDVVMARMDEAKAMQSIRVAKQPFSPRVVGGSGLAYTNGFPLTIDGAAPAVFQARGDASLYNKSQLYAVAQARENARGVGFAVEERRDEIVYRVASLFIDVDRAGRLSESAQKQLESLSKVLEAVNTRVEAGRELPITRQEARLNLLKARQRLLSLQADRDYAEHSLAVSLGFDSGDTVQPAVEERPVSAIAASEEAALRAALDANKELKRLESNYQARGLQVKGDRAQRLPRVDLVAQYALFAKFNDYSAYFNRFKYNNGELGASVQIPLIWGPGVNAQVMQDEADQQHIRAEIQAARSRIALEVHQSYQEIEKAEMSGQVAKADLDLAHEQLSVLLAQMNEGRAGLKQVEEARFAEDEKWIAFYDAQFGAEKARLNVLRHTGELTAALR